MNFSGIVTSTQRKQTNQHATLKPTALHTVQMKGIITPSVNSCCLPTQLLPRLEGSADVNQHDFFAQIFKWDSRCQSDKHPAKSLSFVGSLLPHHLEHCSYMNHLKRLHILCGLEAFLDCTAVGSCHSTRPGGNSSKRVRSAPNSSTAQATSSTNAGRVGGMPSVSTFVKSDDFRGRRGEVNQECLHWFKLT